MGAGLCKPANEGSNQKLSLPNTGGVTSKNGTDAKQNKDTQIKTDQKPPGPIPGKRPMPPIGEGLGGIRPPEIEK